MKRTLEAWILSETKPPAATSAADRRRIAEAIRRHEFKGRAGDQALLFEPVPTLLLGARVEEPGADRARAVYEAAIRAADFARKNRFDALRLRGLSSALAEVAARGVAAGLYRFRITAKKPKEPVLAWTVDALTPAGKQRAAIVAASSALARTLVDTPPAEKTPALYVNLIRNALPRKGLRVTVWDEKKLKAERCNGILAVGRGSIHGPRLVRIDYAPARATRRLVLVGKGLTFDSGGLNIKTYEGMKTMKCDMAGSAAIVGALVAIARLGLPVRVTALLGIAENMPGGRAFRPGDVIRTRSGQTVEIQNTDAEGRVVLADLLDLAREIPADAIIDLATLTGACLVALGEETAGLFTANEALARDLLAAGDASGEPLWRLPFGRDFRAKVKGEISDLKNVGGRYGGASSAAAFLAAFIEKRVWAHLDIAGPAFREGHGAGRPSGATGFGVATLVALAERRA